MTLNMVVLGVLACIENEAVRNEILKSYELKIQKLKHYNDYINSEDFKSKKVNDVNFQNCVNYAITRLEDEKFRLFVQKADICCIAFYKKNIQNTNMIKSSSPTALDSLKGIIVKYYIEESTLFVCVNPVSIFKERVLRKSDDIIKLFNENGKDIDNVKVKFIHNDKILDDLEETFLELGYNLQKK